jgi:hypothetical protein
MQSLAMQEQMCIRELIMNSRLVSARLFLRGLQSRFPMVM